MFAYCGNNPVNNMDSNGNMYRGIPSLNPTFGLPSKITQPPYADHPQAIEETPSAEGNSSDGFLTEEQMNENATIIYNRLIEKGWSSNAICAVLGNMQPESYTINPGKRQDYGGPGYGLVQWDPASKYLD